MHTCIIHSNYLVLKFSHCTNLSLSLLTCFQHKKCLFNIIKPTFLIMNMFSLDLSYQPNLFKANFVYVREICMDGLFQLTSAQVHLK
jgi:hypothetical protein